MGALVLGALVAGCQVHDVAMPDEPFPKLSDIRSRVTPPGPPEDAPRMAPTRRALADVQVITLPLATDLGESWEQVDEGVLGDRARDVWNRNGLRLALIQAEQIEAFFEPASHLVYVRHTRLLSAAHPSMLRDSSRLEAPVTLELRGVHGVEQEQIELERGRIRLLLRMEPNDAGGVTVQLLPHHQRVRSTLIPRDPLERDLDGRVFEELSVAFDMGRADVLVIGLHWPWPDEDEQQVDEEADEEADGEPDAASPAPQGQGQAELTEPAEAHAEAEPELQWQVEFESPQHDSAEAERMPELPAHIGRALLAGQRAGRSVQHVLLIRVAPAGGGR